MNEAKEEMLRMLNEDELRDAALLVLANKQVYALVALTLICRCLIITIIDLTACMVVYWLTIATQCYLSLFHTPLKLVFQRLLAVSIAQ